MTTTRIYVPLDSAALAMGADDVAEAIANEAQARNSDIELIRNGSRGLHWLEPLVEVETAEGRLAYGPVAASDIESLFDAGFLSGGDHSLAHGPVEAIPFFARQERLTFRRCGLTDPLDLESYEAHGGWAGLRAALSKDPAGITEEVMASGLRGRGGAAFPAGIKWRTVLGADGNQKYIVCNADEGDSGTFADRMIMEGDPYLLIEGMIIAGLGVGADKGYIYLRSEYPVAARILAEALSRAEAAGFLGADILGGGKRFSLSLFIGAGAYICGEETSLLDSLEGKRGQVRAKPPLPAIEGLNGCPTLVHNVISLCAVPDILTDGGAAYAAKGVGKSTGTMPFQLAGNVKRGGLLELPFGMTIRDIVENMGGGTRSGRPIKAVQIGGPLGAYLPESLFDTALDYEAMTAIGAGIGHGGLVVYDDTTDMAAQARYAFAFCAHESCGKCTPCRIGAVRGVEVMDKIMTGQDVTGNLALIADLSEVMIDGSLCAMGGMTPIPVQSAIRHFPDDFATKGKG